MEEHVNREVYLSSLRAFWGTYALWVKYYTRKPQNSICLWAEKSTFQIVVKFCVKVADAVQDEYSVKVFDMYIFFFSFLYKFHWYIVYDSFF